MKKIIYIILMHLSILTHSQTIFNWAKQIGGVGNDKAKTIAVDASGNVYSAGSFSGTIDVDPGPGIFSLTALGSQDIFILKLDVSGNFTWAKQIGGQQQNYISSIVLDAANNIYATGYFSGVVDFDPGAGTTTLSSNGNSDAFNLKLDANGSFLWANNIGDIGNDYSFDITTDPSGNIYTCGTYSGTVDFDPSPATLNLSSIGMQDVFISKLDANGGLIWVKSVGGSSLDISSSIAVDVTGNVVVTGYNAGVADMDPSAATYTINTIVGYYQTFILKLDQIGNFIFAKQFENLYVNSGNSPSSIIIDGLGNIYTAGNFSGQADMDPGLGNSIISCSGGISSTANNTYISKLDANGNFVWAKRITGVNYSYDLALDALKNVFVVGYFVGVCDFDPGTAVFNQSATGSSISSLGNPDIYILKLDENSNFIWAYKIGGNSDDGVNAVSIDAAGNIYTCGYFDGNDVDFDLGTNVFSFSTIGNKDVFIYKMAQTSVGINEIAASNRLTVFPNPAGNYLNIILDEESFEKLNSATIEVHNSLGQLVLKEKLNSQKNHIDTKDLCNGVYVLNILTNEGIISKKIVKQ